MGHAYVLCPVTVRGFCSELEAHELITVGDQLPPQAPPLESVDESIGNLRKTAAD